MTTDNPHLILDLVPEEFDTRRIEGITDALIVMMNQAFPSIGVSVDALVLKADPYPLVDFRFAFADSPRFYVWHQVLNVIPNEPLGLTVGLIFGDAHVRMSVFRVGYEAMRSR